MNTSSSSLPVSASQGQGGMLANGSRFDMYGAIHKALRHFMADTLYRVGRMDLDDRIDREDTLNQLDALLLQLRSHLNHENDFIHPAIEARRPGGARHTADDHLQHLEAIANLEDSSHALRQTGTTPSPANAPRARRLYQQLALFFGQNLEHMQIEEQDNQALLWALYTDEELQAVQDRLLAAIGPAEMALTVRWMSVSLNPQELAGLFGAMRAKAPPQAFNALYEIAQSHLDLLRAAKLSHALGLPAVPGLVN